jgi:hypothetical protein
MQSNKVMSGFKNKGWKYFEMCQDIMSGTTARGNHAFSVVTSIPFILQAGGGEDEGGSGGGCRASVSLRVESMDVDCLNSSTLVHQA